MRTDRQTDMTKLNVSLYNFSVAHIRNIKPSISVGGLCAGIYNELLRTTKLIPTCCPIIHFITTFLYLVKLRNRLAQIMQFTCFKHRWKKHYVYKKKGNGNGIIIQDVARWRAKGRAIRAYGTPRVIPGFRRKVNVICALPWCYAAQSGNSVPTFRHNVSVSSSRFTKLWIPWKIWENEKSRNYRKWPHWKLHSYFGKYWC